MHPPSTATVVSTLPAGESGAASAVDNTFRQVGGSLGAAVLGSVLNVAYRARIDPAGGGLGDGLAERARGSVAATLQAAQDLAAHGHDPHSYSVAQTAYGGFLHAMRTTWLAASVVVLVTTVFVFLVMGPGPSGGAGQAVADLADGLDQIRGTEPSA
ncbi:hypothetical protein GTY54_38675 [Streptomyces sp. SID625]|nr:hypothetical protein [Streptomyces sp. SID625]